MNVSATNLRIAPRPWHPAPPALSSQPMSDKPQDAIISMSSPAGAHEFITAFHAAPAGTDIEFRFGQAADDGAAPLIVVSIGPRLFAFTKPQAEIMCDIIAEGIEKFGDHGGWADLTFGLRRAIVRDRPSTARPAVTRVTFLPPL